jgi:hypothetical protein
VALTYLLLANASKVFPRATENLCSFESLRVNSLRLAAMSAYGLSETCPGENQKPVSRKEGWITPVTALRFSVFLRLTYSLRGSRSSRNWRRRNPDQSGNDTRRLPLQKRLQSVTESGGPFGKSHLFRRVSASFGV